MCRLFMPMIYQLVPLNSLCVSKNQINEVTLRTLSTFMQLVVDSKLEES
jgi:hypothetical protein